MSEGVFTVGVVPAFSGLETSTTGIVAVEWLDTAETFDGRRRDGARRVVLAEELPFEVELNEVIARVGEICRELGPDARVVYSKEGSAAVTVAWNDAHSRTHELPSWPRAVTIAGEGLGEDGQGHARVGEDELIDKSLRQLVKTKAFTIAPGAEQVAAAARAMVPEVSVAGRLKLGPRKRTSLGFALALALYHSFAPTHNGRRYLAAGKTFESKAAAVARLGQLAESG